jgi:hypothetical protein
MLEMEPNLYAALGEMGPSLQIPERKSKSRRRLWALFLLHVCAIVSGYFVARHEAVFFSGAISEFLVMAPLVVAFYVCPIAVVVTVRSAPRYPFVIRVCAVAVDLVLCILQIVVLLPLVQ